ncbi:hypothetical protein [Nocardioides sp.]|uniref:hypothetical protein n=1 Tax=Nocardioides sp. TaxID=35761 RepID=UPI003566AC07
MLVVTALMLLILLLSGLVVTFVAFPHRGYDVPGATWLGDAMRSAVLRLPTLHNTEGPARD